MAGISLSAPAKINLYLEVIARRGDGFHDIESIFQEISLSDELTFSLRSDNELRLTSDHPGLPCDESNLVVRAGRILQRETGCHSGADIHLIKRIPMGGGLGGGSSNAAAALMALNSLWGCNFPFHILMELAAALGSDVPFFLFGGTCLCRGRGEIVTRLPAFPPIDILLIFPEWGISTPLAYAALKREELGTRPVNVFLAALERGEIAEILPQMYNRFEGPVFSLEPKEGELFEALSRLGLRALRMSGSGSTLFGIPAAGMRQEVLVEQICRLPGVRDVIPVTTASVPSSQ